MAIGGNPSLSTFQEQQTTRINSVMQQDR